MKALKPILLSGIPLQGYLENLEKPYDIRCPMCNRKLRLWPDDKMGQAFTCDQGCSLLSFKHKTYINAKLVIVNAFRSTLRTS